MSTEPEARPPAAPGGAAFPRAAFALAVALAAVAAGPTARVLAVRWGKPHGYESHGPLVPLVSAWLFWRDRLELAAIARRGSAAGALVCAGALWLLVAGTLQGILGPQALAVVLLAVGVALAFFGRAFVRRAWFAFAYLLFAVPAPASVNLALSLRLQALAAWLSAGTLHVFGVPAAREGSLIHLAVGSVSVGDACSGLRGLTALLALAAFVAALPGKRSAAVAVLVAAAPVAIVANAARIVLLCALCLAGHPAEPGGALHEASGLLVYAVALALLLGLHRAFGADELTPRAAAPAPAHSAPSRAVAALLLAVLAVGAAGVAYARWLRPTERRPTAVAHRVPRTLGTWSGVDLPVGSDVLAVLGTDDVLVRRFWCARLDATVDVYVNHVAGEIDRIWHPPEACYEGAGMEIEDEGFATLETPRRTIPTRRVLFRRDGQRVLIHYWYRIDGQDVARYLDLGSRALLKRLAGFGASEATLVRLATSGEGGTGAASSRIARFADEGLDPLLDALSGPPP